jgi:pimeloyl-ACP methyl ester carboxylesterase
VIVFVHGVPETQAIWDQVRSELGLESMALSLPGFGIARPASFAATKDDYVNWLLAELARIDGPIDLVGHDWGATLTNRVVTAHDDQIRSWVTDGLMHPEYVWHEFAKIWQTPGEGEAFWSQMLAAPLEQKAAIFEGYGVPHDAALEMSSRIDETMASCILDLYRSAMPNPFASWSYPMQPVAAPGLVLLASEESFGNPALTHEAAVALGARVQVLEGVGHWWALQAPAQGAAVLREFFESLD